MPSHPDRVRRNYEDDEAFVGEAFAALITSVANGSLPAPRIGWQRIRDDIGNPLKDVRANGNVRV